MRSARSTSSFCPLNNTESIFESEFGALFSEWNVNFLGALKHGQMFYTKTRLYSRAVCYTLYSRIALLKQRTIALAQYNLLGWLTLWKRILMPSDRGCSSRYSVRTRRQITLLNVTRVDTSEHRVKKHIAINTAMQPQRSSQFLQSHCYRVQRRFLLTRGHI